MEEQQQVAKLPAELAQKITQYQKVEDRQIRIRSKLLLLKSLEKSGFQRSLCDVKYNSFGKPFFVEGPHFNLSHSGDVVACIIAKEGNVGIDTEANGEKCIEEYFPMLPPEFQLKINDSYDKHKTFLEYWTGYEAVVKATGKGLYIPIDQVQIKGQLALIEDQKFFIKSINISDETVTTIAMDMPIDDVVMQEILL